MPTLVRYASLLPAPLSTAVRAGGLLFLSGQTPKNADLTPLRGTIEEQTRNVIEAIRSTLAEFGLDLSSVVRCTVWLSDIELMARFNAVYAEYFPGDKPARYCIRCELVKSDCLVEVASVAHIG